MKFRYARHTNSLSTIIEFYTKIIGFEILGSFENHSNYNGVILGLPNTDWQLEFTESKEKAIHAPDPDDLVVIYLNSEKERDSIKIKAILNGYSLTESKNPYWKENGIQINDPDNFGVILALENK